MKDLSFTEDLSTVAVRLRNEFSLGDWNRQVQRDTDDAPLKRALNDCKCLLLNVCNTITAVQNARKSAFGCPPILKIKY